MMRYAPGHKEESRARIVDAAGRSFRKKGYGGAGVDDLAREAGVTHGAFYNHFRSKAEAFEAATVAGLKELRSGIETLRTEHGENWVSEFVAFYLGYKCTCDLAQACTLPSLTAEVERADLNTRSAYARELELVIQAVADGLAGGTEGGRRARSQALLSLLVGGVTIVRVIPDQSDAEQIAAAIRDSALVIAERDVAPAATYNNPI